MRSFLTAVAALYVASQSIAQSHMFDRGAKEIQLGVSYQVSFHRADEDEPHVRDSGLHLRVGWMLNAPAGKGVLRGNTEFLAEFLSDHIIEGPGKVIAGTSFLLRFNFLSGQYTTVPYVQIGAGIVYTDIHEKDTQILIGQAIEFNPQVGVGIRFHHRANMKVYVEAGWRHISNADTAARNLGLNSLGFQVGVSWHG